MWKVGGLPLPDHELFIAHATVLQEAASILKVNSPQLSFWILLFSVAAANQLRLLPHLYTPVRAWSITLLLQDAAVGVEEGDMALLAEALAEKASVKVFTFCYGDFFV